MDGRLNNDGFLLYKSFCQAPPRLLVEWHDSETEAIGWLAINSLTNGAAGGGTRMRSGATREEAIFLAKTMEIKFKVAGPPIGGAKSVINFNSDDPRKREVLKRWFQSIGPYLRHCYGTAGDFGVDEQDLVIPLTTKYVGIRHPQEGIIHGHIKANEQGYLTILNQFNEGLNAPVNLKGVGTFKLAEVITGYGVARSIIHLFKCSGIDLTGKRILAEGFGAVAGPAAYYLALEGARIVAIVSRRGDGAYQVARDEGGLDIPGLLLRREAKRYLPLEFPLCDQSTEFWETEADIVINATASYSIDHEKLHMLRNLGVRTIVGAANNPFAEATIDGTEVQQKADSEFTVIPDFIANCGIARAFAYLMQDRSSIQSSAIFDDVDKTIKEAMCRILQGKNCSRTGLLNDAYSAYLAIQQTTALNQPEAAIV